MITIMKRILYLSIAIVCLLSASCRKDQVAVNGITATKDLTPWNTTDVYTGFKPLSTKDTLFITGHNGEENIIIAIKQKGAGTYQPGEFKAYFYTTIGQDVIVSKYQLYNDPANTIVITDYDETKQIIKGTFTLVFKSTYIYNNTLPDKVTFTNGKISTQLSATNMNPYK
ncbi:MAG: hypothetical protein JWR67_3689 [Mucilaginibacter sp.]|nr:hypothetical protein [Mucilaginibacter sp.]